MLLGQFLALFYGLPNKSLEEGLKLIYTDKDVHSFFADAEMNGKIHLYIGHKQQDLGRYYLRNMVWVEEDTGLRCSSSTPLSTRIKRKRTKTSTEGLRKKVNLRMVDDEPVGRKLIQTSRKGKEIMYELTGSPTKESRVRKVDVGNKEDARRRTNMLGLLAPKVQGSTVKKYQGLALDGYIDVGGSSKHCDLVHENVVDNGHSLPNMDKEIFLNNVVLDDVVTDTLAYTLPLVLKKKCRNKVNVTRKTRCLNNSKTMRLKKGLGKRVACGANNRRLGTLIGLNVHVVDDDPQVTKQVLLTAGSSNTKVKDLE
ncbi:hypothetical protein Tco_1396540 [Tanacetum coccineum]